MTVAPKPYQDVTPAMMGLLEKVAQSKPLDPLHVEVKFGSGVPYDVRSAALLAFEKMLRDLTNDELWIEVFQESRGDDSRLRALMTPEQRAKL